MLAGLVSGGVMGCGVTSEVGSARPGPSATASTAIGPAPGAATVRYAPEDGRPRAPRSGAGALPGARVTARPPAEAAPAAARSAAAAAEAKAIALGSPTRRIQSGRIVDEAGQPLVGATVLLQGTTRGASTDANGDYSLPVPLGTNTFVFAYSGYEQEIAQSRDGQPLLVTLLPAPGSTPAPPEPLTKARAHKKH
ncbi:carboxypeptidase-like regulatory domain-containing protein [Hymenobacter bucti]|uniref:Carboxypeptidase-like regulatory domain-containing protein n=1 Tax=Hymenobacter bucti TaxID=1844114 RepID=A0ABW4R0N0_9BACT